ncbi:MAG TPA: cytochrome c maturation protein CcmE [Acidimicrobiales bacterium]|nr:cytochrome c maturation protein CcmE [Acidimicrobiales bacterium]
MELTPRTLDPEHEGDEVPVRGRARRRHRRWLPLAVFVVAVLGLGLFAYKGLSDAALYFRTADEAVAQRDSLGTKRFRLEGTVVGEPVEDGGLLHFAVVFNGVSVNVEHQGSPPDLFRVGQPVVIEGHWQEGGELFLSDRILVKHDETYTSKEDYQDRVSEAEEGGEPGGEPQG